MYNGQLFLSGHYSLLSATCPLSFVYSLSVMYYSKQLLSRYISGNVDLENLARDLTMKVCEVEEVHPRIIPEEVVIGRVLEARKHPNADKLTICQLDCGKLGTYQICT